MDRSSENNQIMHIVILKRGMMKWESKITFKDKSFWHWSFCCQSPYFKSPSFQMIANHSQQRQCLWAAMKEGLSKKETITCDCVLYDCVLQVLTHPFFAAFPWQTYKLWVRTVRSWKTRNERASWYASHSSPFAVAVCVTRRFKGLAFVVSDTVHLTAKVLLT